MSNNPHPPHGPSDLNRQTQDEDQQHELDRPVTGPNQDPAETTHHEPLRHWNWSLDQPAEPAPAPEHEYPM